MKPAPFRLASVLKLYASREDQARARYGEAVRAREFAAEALAAAHAELNANTEAYGQHRDTAGFAAASHARHWLVLQEGQARCRTMLDQLNKARFAEAQVQAELVVARRAHESVIKLRERHDEQQRLEALRQDEHAMGDIFNANFVLRRARTA